MYYAFLMTVVAIPQIAKEIQKSKMSSISNKGFAF